jgi:hypothetical protein
LVSTPGRKRLHDELVCSLAGRLAQERLTGGHHAADAGKDRGSQVLLAIRALATLEELQVLFGQQGTEEQKRQITKDLYLRSHDHIAEAHEEAAGLVASEWQNIQSLAEQLVLRRRITGGEAVRIIGDG